MTAQPKSVIKSYFETGDRPTQAQFVDLVDSYLDAGSVSAGSNGAIIVVSGNPSAVNGTLGQVLTSNGAAVAPSFQTLSGAGTVTSAGLTMPNIFAVAGSPITNAGQFVVTLSAQAQKLVLASPASASGTPTFRALLASDLPTSGLQPQMTVFTASGTFTTSSNITASTRFKFTLTGGGGGGGNNRSAAQSASGSGGGAGATAIYEVAGLTASTGYTVTIGAGGAATTAGGDTTIVIGATTVTAGGGGAGVNGAAGGGQAGGVGGTPTNGTINIIGGDGGATASDGAQYCPGGVGGASFNGGGGAGGISPAVGPGGVGNVGKAYGSGGGGGGGSQDQSSKAGGAGKAGVLYAEWFE